MPATAALIAAASPASASAKKRSPSMSPSASASVLQGNGYRVIMTRNSDVFIPLGQRTAIANSYRGATFVSVHFNSATRAGANGIETYYYRGDSAGLAANIHRNVVAISPTENRGIRRRGYYVLRRTNIRGVLVECGFLTNPTEGRYALQANYRQKLAEAIARGIQGQRAPISQTAHPRLRLVRGSLAPTWPGPISSAPRRAPSPALEEIQQEIFALLAQETLEQEELRQEEELQQQEEKESR